MDARVEKLPAGWRSERGEASLADVHRSIAVRSSGPGWRRAAAFVGPGYLVAPRWLVVFAYLIAVVIAALTVKLLVDFVGGAG